MSNPSGIGDAKTPRNIFSLASTASAIEEGATVIIYLSRDMIQSCVVTADGSANTRYGQYAHSDMIGKRYGSKMISASGSGFCHLLRPTPELWSLALAHRTQILYMPDIAFITSYLDIKPGSRVIEAGTGSGSFSHSLARTIGGSGQLFSFEFHEPRCDAAREEFEAHGLSDIIKLEHRNVCKDGFGDVQGVDAVFLDLPAPWEAIPYAKDCLAKDRMARICCFSPCIEQVTKTVAALHEHGFTTVTMYETLQRQHDMATYSMPTIDDAIDKLKGIEARKISRRQHQSSQHKQQQGKADEKRKAEDLDDSEEQPATKRLKEEPATDTATPDMSTTAANTPDVADTPTADSDAKDTPEVTVVSSSLPGDAPTPPTKREPTPRQVSKKMVPPEQRFTSSKPAAQIRGHTSYLTFAFLVPDARV